MQPYCLMKIQVIGILLLITSLPIFAQNWQQIGPPGGYFKEFTIHPTNPSIVYAGSDDGGGVWKTTNGGASWRLQTIQFPNMTGWKIVLDQQAPDTLFACDVYGRYGILKSINGGRNWKPAANGLSTAYDKMVSGLIMLNTDTLLISTGESATTDPPRPGNGIFFSTDEGFSWTARGLQGQTTPCIAKNIFQTIFVGTESNGLHYSNDVGANWIPHPDVSSAATIHEIDVRDSVILIGSNAGVYLSTNYGINFTNIGLTGDFNFDVSIHQLQPQIELYASTFTGLQHYSTATSSWSLVNSPELNGQLIIGIASDGNNIYGSTFSNHLMVQSTNGGTSWSAISTPVATEINDLYLDPSNSNRMLTGMMGSYNIGGSFNEFAVRETNDGGMSWVDKGPAAHALAIVANPLNTNSFYLGTFSSGLFKTNNSFNSFVQLISGNKLIGDIAISNEDTNVVLITEVDLDLVSASIKRSTNGGGSFTVADNLVANRLLFNTSNNDTAYAATEDGVYLSIDNGVSWNPWVLNGENILSIHFSDGLLYAGNEQGTLYKIENSLAVNISGTWQTPVELKSIHTINGQLLVGLNGAEKDTIHQLFGSLWVSSDTGNTWTNETGNMTSTNVYGNNVIAVNGNEVYVGTYGGGIFKSDLFFSTVNEIHVESGYIIYPNPTSNQLIIRSAMDKITDLKVLNAIGQEVSSLVTTSSLDNKILSVDLSGLQTGTYLLKINNSNLYKLNKQ